MHTYIQIQFYSILYGLSHVVRLKSCCPPHATHAQVLILELLQSRNELLLIFMQPN